MLDSLKDAFAKLPPKVKVFLVGLGTAAGAAGFDALVDGIYALWMGEVAPSRESFRHVLGAAFAAALLAARAYTAQSPLPRRIWTWQEREAERLAALEKDKR